MSRQAEPSARVPRRVLVLDDDPGVGATMRRVAERGGYEARHVTTAEALFRLLPEWPPAVIVLDLVMPDMDGVEVISSLAARGERIPLILVSGVGSRVLDAARRSANAHGLHIAGILAKPFTVAQLTDAFAAVVGERGGRDAEALPGAGTPETSVTPVDVRDLERALDGGVIGVALQPKVNCRTGTLAGLEVLARWNDPERGAIPPDVFISLAERHGLIDQLTRVVSGQALRWLATVIEAGGDHSDLAPILGRLTLSLNVSATSLGNRSLFEAMLGQCADLGISPERIVLELTETSAMRDAVTALDNLTRLRLHGFRLSIDDFGTGYSSMAQLVRLPFSEIKVDKSFVLTARESVDSRAIVRSTIDLGHSLGLYTTAEGVEDDWAMGFLADAGCHFVQGYGIAPPMAPHAVLPWIRAREAERERRRLQATRTTGLLDTPPEARFDRLVGLARRLFDVPIAFVGLLDERRLWFKAYDGLSSRVIPRDTAFCNTAIAADDPLIVEDAASDPHFRDNPLVTGAPFIRFYAGQPLCAPGGQKVGTLCVIDQRPRTLDQNGRVLLGELAAFVERELAADRVSGRDPVTGLPGREAFRDEASAMLALLGRLGCTAYLVVVRFLDLALVNRHLGREAGDGLLRALAEIVRGSAGPTDLIGRRRGTEIATLIVDAHRGAGEALGERIERAVVAYNRDQPDDGPIIRCDIAHVPVAPDANGGLDHLVRERAVPIATILDRHHECVASGPTPVPPAVASSTDPAGDRD